MYEEEKKCWSWVSRENAKITEMVIGDWRLLGECGLGTLESKGQNIERIHYKDFEIIKDNDGSFGEAKCKNLESNLLL